jgi:hypothetical protein
MKKEMKNTFEPHICAEGDIPALCFAPGHYLSWFRGYRFQISSADDGIHELGGSVTTMNSDLQLTYDLPAEIRPLIALSHICEAAAPFDAFWDLVVNDPKLVNGFISVTDDMCGICSSAFDIAGIEPMIQTKETAEVYAIISDQNIFAASRPFICAVQDGSVYMPLGNLILCRDSVLIQDSETGLAYKLPFPDYIYIGENIKAIENEYYGLMWSRLPWILFSYAEIILDGAGCQTRYKNNAKETIQKTNQISNKNEFYEFIKNSLIVLENGANHYS